MIFVFFSAVQLYGQGQFQTFGHQNAEWGWGLKGRQNSLKDDELVKLSLKEIEKLRLYEKNEQTGRGDIYWVGGKLYFDNDGSIFNGRNESSPDQMDKPRFLEVMNTGDKKAIRLLRISSQKGVYNFYIVKELLVTGEAKLPKAERPERVKTAPPPSVQSRAPLKEKEISPTPLQKYDISQLKLVSIIASAEGNIGLVEDSTGKGYFVKRGTLIGKNDGKVSKVLKDRVIVEEVYNDSSGQRKVNEISLVFHHTKEESGRPVADSKWVEVRSALPEVTTGQDQSKNIVPFKDGYCSVEGPHLIIAKPGASFSFSSTIEYKGQKFQAMIPKTEDAYMVGSINVQLLNKDKEPHADVRKLECSVQKWNPALNTVDLIYSDNKIVVIVHIYTPADAGFIIKEVECKVPSAKK
jgi:hypothetical protein